MEMRGKEEMITELRNESQKISRVRNIMHTDIYKYFQPFSILIALHLLQMNDVLNKKIRTLEESKTELETKRDTLKGMLNIYIHIYLHTYIHKYRRGLVVGA